MKKSICIIGAGTYGSYLAYCLSEKHPDATIHLFDVGGSRIRSESEIGFLSDVKGSYKATSEGRYFGLGGTSAKWGGQLLFFSEKDFPTDKSMQKMVDCNRQYHKKVLGRFFKNTPGLDERDLARGQFLKQGIWLKFGQRNLFHHFRIRERKNIIVHEHARVVGLASNGDKIVSITIMHKNDPKPEVFTADIFYLTSGAFESLRLMKVSELLNEEPLTGFSDHVSLRCFEVMGKPVIGSNDFQFRFVNGSLITTRIVGEVENTSYYVHPIFNEQFNLFQFLKQVIFKGKFSLRQFLSVWRQAFFLIPFLATYLFKKRLYVYGSWFLNIDLELVKSENRVGLSEKLDEYGQQGLELDYRISRQTRQKLEKARLEIKAMLDETGTRYRELNPTAVSMQKLEDTYHPYRLFPSGDGQSDYFHPLRNLYLFNTGLLARSGGINPTAALFCLIEKHVDESWLNEPIANPIEIEAGLTTTIG
jgi:hypothetical protein